MVILLNRVQALKRLAFEKKGFDGFLVFNMPNLLYFTDYAESAALLVPKSGDSPLYVYSLNYKQAKERCP